MKRIKLHTPNHKILGFAQFFIKIRNPYKYSTPTPSRIIYLFILLKFLYLPTFYIVQLTFPLFSVIYKVCIFYISPHYLYSVSSTKSIFIHFEKHLILFAILSYKVDQVNREPTNENVSDLNGVIKQFDWDYSTVLLISSDIIRSTIFYNSTIQTNTYTNI